MQFDLAYRQFLAYHTARRKGERLRRLREGHGHAERLFLETVWWPAFGNLRHLHPEYEIVDYDGRPRYLDFAYIRGSLRLAVEVDGYGPHVSRIDRHEFIRQLRRQNHLVIDGWAVLRFSFDEVLDHARACQQVLQQFMGRWSDDGAHAGLNALERAVVQFAGASTGRVTPKQIRQHLGVGKHKAAKVIRRLVDLGWLEPASGRQRIRSYRLKTPHMAS